MKKFDYMKNFRYFLIAALVVVVAGAFVLGFLGFNKDVQYTEHYEIKIVASDIGGAEKDALSLSQIRKMPLSDGGSFELTVVADRFSVEIFSDGRSMTNTVYPKETSNGIQLDIAARAFTMEIGEISL